MTPIMECPGAPTKHPRNDPAGELRRLADDVECLEDFVLPEHMDRLALIGNDIIRIYRPNPEFAVRLQEYEDSVARWCVCSDVFWEFHGECREVSGLTPQCAEVSEVDDCGEPEVNSPA